MLHCRCTDDFVEAHKLSCSRFLNNSSLYVITVLLGHGFLFVKSHKDGGTIVGEPVPLELRGAQGL